MPTQRTGRSDSTRAAVAIATGCTIAAITIAVATANTRKPPW